MDSPKELISVIVPVYNTGLYLTSCVNSILAQDYLPLEIVIVDDGSTDEDSIRLCDTLALQNENVRTYHKPNGGSASARNYGLSKAKGEYIGFVDSDDQIERNMYSSLYRDIKSFNVNIAVSGLSTEDNEHIIEREASPISGVCDRDTLLHYFFLGYWHSACPNLYKKKLFVNASFPEGEINEDYWLNYTLFKNQRHICVSSQVFYHYLRRPHSNTSSPATLKFLDWIKHTKSILADYAEGNPLFEEALFQYLYSNIVLGNKCLLTLADGDFEDADIIYDIITRNLRELHKEVWRNRFLSFKYRICALALAYCPNIYKFFILKSIGKHFRRNG